MSGEFSREVAYFQRCDTLQMDLVNECAVSPGSDDPAIGRRFAPHEISRDQLGFPARRFVVGKLQALVIKDWARRQVEFVKRHFSKPYYTRFSSSVRWQTLPKKEGASVQWCCRRPLQAGPMYRQYN
jgi:hypothetical protein